MQNSSLSLALLAILTMGFVPQNEVHVVTASYYKSGEITANGEKFDPMGMTAAHRLYKFGTMLEVYNQDTGKKVVVRVNDRGPYIDGRSLDLSLGAAQALGMIESGLADVQIKKIN